MGNSRVSFTEGTNGNVQVVEENSYYAFGLQHKGYGPTPTGLGNGHAEQYKYQGQERQEELGLDWDSFEWRNYDYAIGRFMSVDPLAEKYDTWSPYAYSGNRVVDARELEGLEPYIITGRAFIPNKTLPNPNPLSSTTSFAGDNRQSYQARTNAYRTEQKVLVDFDNNKVTSLSNKANGTIGYDKNGNIKETSSSVSAGPTPTYTANTMNEGWTTVHMEVDASNKLVTGAPAINYDVNVTIIDQGMGNFEYEISGASDGFPAYEFFITNEATGNSYLIYGSNPGATEDSPMSLFPPMDNNIQGSGSSKNLEPVEQKSFK